MDINKIFEEELKKELQEKLKKYENKIFLSNEDIMKELSISSLANLRKQIAQGIYQGLYEEKKSKKEHYRWNKFKFFKWYYQQKLDAINVA
jgi:hypothetical protein